MGLGPGIAIRKDRKPPKSRLPVPDSSASSPARHVLSNPRESIDEAFHSDPASTLSKPFIPKSSATAITESVKAKIRRPYETNPITPEKRLTPNLSNITRPLSAGKPGPNLSSSSATQPATKEAQAALKPIKPLPRQAQSTLVLVNPPPDPVTKKMAYTLPHSHVCSPCVLLSLTHRLSCNHLVLTAEPTQICAGNCADSGANARSLYSIPPNPRDLDLLILCPQCGSDVKRESKGFGWGRKRANIILSQLIHESVIPEFPISPRQRVRTSSNSENGKDEDAGNEKAANPLNFNFPGCTPAKKKNDSAMFMPGDDKVAERPPRPQRVIDGRDGLREFKLPELAAER